MQGLTNRALDPKFAFLRKPPRKSEASDRNHMGGGGVGGHQKMERYVEELAELVLLKKKWLYYPMQSKDSVQSP